MFLLTTERLFLRHFHMQDAEAMEHVFGDPEVMMYSDGVKSREWIETWLRTSSTQYEQQGFGPYAVIQKDNQHVIGYCGLFHFPNVNGNPEIELGYRLMRSAWGQGYATESALAVRDYAFEALKLQRLIAIIDPANVTSIRVAEKIGMQYEQGVMFDGYSHPDHVYVIKRF